jgi:serine/threonine-protein kinase
VGSDGIARITDFGVAKAEVRLSSTRDGQFKGKLAYMAPEQASTGFADQRSDLFGMGVVLWESLVGRRLFKAENNGELLNRLLYAEIPAPSEYVPELAPLDAVLVKALERAADARFQSAAEFVDAIEAAAASVGGIGNQRAVGRSVKELLGAKVESESARIQSAIDSLGRSEVSSAAVPRPEPSGLLSVSELPSGERVGSQSQPSQVRRAAPEDTTLGAKPATLEAPEPKSTRLPLIIAGVVALLLVLAGAGWLATRSNEPELAAVPTPPPPTAPTQASTPPAALTPLATTAPGTEMPAEVVGVDGPSEPAVTARDEREDSARPRRPRSGTTTTMTTAASTETTPAMTTTTAAPPPPEDDDEVIPSPYQ